VGIERIGWLSHGGQGDSVRRAGLAAIDPPVYLLLCLALMVLVHLLVPGATGLGFPWRALGILPLVLGIGLNLAADRSFKRHGTAVKPLGKSTVLVTSGAFRVSRHPMYLGFVLILLGVALLMGSLTPVALVLGFALFMDRVFVRYEERKLEATFGQAWLDYSKRVRRWV
jgi:protein-S-isoprenylcysteine O-methyltransferase Ste14